MAITSGEWACVAVFEFGDGATEEQELHRGSEDTCLRLAARLERAQESGRGIRYNGNRSDPLHTIVAVAPAAAVGEIA